jgi:putative RecB family exonuclease
MENKTLRISYSALDTFKQCPLKYKFQVIDKIKAPKTKEAVFGGKLHEALEWFHKQNPVSPTLDQLLNQFKEIWPARQASQVAGVAGGASPLFGPDEDLIYFSEAIKILKNYYEHYLKIKDNFSVLGTETRFEVLLENPENKEEKCLLTGIIDRIDKTKDGIEIIDYKTTKKLPSQEDIHNSMQMSLYCLGIMNRWPQFIENGIENIKLTLYYLKHQETISTHRTREQLDGVQKHVWMELKKIEKSEFGPMPSVLCDWCGYKKICPMWKHLYKETAIDDEQIKKVINQFLELKNNNTQNNKKINELKEIIENYLDREKIERVFGDSGFITRLTQLRIGGYDIKKLEQIIKTLPSPIQEQLEPAKKPDKKYIIIKASSKKPAAN